MRPTSDILAELEERELLDVARAIASRLHVLLAETLSTSRISPAPTARAELWCELAYRGWSYSRIGRLFGCDHTTIAAGAKAVVERRVAAGFCARCGGHRTRPGSKEPCPMCIGRGTARAAS